VQSAQAISATYYFDLAARDYSLADGAIELVVEGIPCSAFIKPSQRSELIFYGRSARLRGGKHAAEGGKSRRDLQGHKKVPDELEFLARVSAQAGEPDRAITAIQKLLSIPSGGSFASSIPLTPALLRLDPLRNDPRFQKLVTSAAPNSVDK
jgi:hypothetical protein